MVFTLFSTNHNFNTINQEKYLQIMKSAPNPAVDKKNLQLLEIGIQKLLEKEIGTKSLIPYELAIEMTKKLEKFKEKKYPEILPYYLFDVESQKLFLDKINKSKDKIVTLHLALTDIDFHKNYSLLSIKPQIQYIFEFDKNGDYFLYFNNNPKETAGKIVDTEVSAEDFGRCTEAYQTSNLYRDLCKYISSETKTLLPMNTERILIDDIEAGTNEVYNKINETPNSELTPFYVYPSMQVLDFSLNATIDQLLRSASQLYSFGIIISNEQKISSSAILDDRHYHCPPNLC